MSFASALNILRSTLPHYIALSKYGLLRITDLYSDNCLSPPTDNYLSPVNG